MTDNKEKIFPERKDVWEKARDVAKEKEMKEREAVKLPIEEENAIQEQLRKEIDLMKLDDGLVTEASEKAKKIEFLGEKEKLEHLLELAKGRGLAFAVNVAKNMNDPYILDTFHDILVKEGFYQRFLKQ